MTRINVLEELQTKRAKYSYLNKLTYSVIFLTYTINYVVINFISSLFFTSNLRWVDWIKHNKRTEVKVLYAYVYVYSLFLFHYTGKLRKCFCSSISTSVFCIFWALILILHVILLKNCMQFYCYHLIFIFILAIRRI